MKSTLESHPPPGIFEPTCDLELQIPVSTISLPAIVQGRTDFSPPNRIRQVNVKPAEKVVEKLLTKTGGHLLLKKKRRKAINRTGFPTKKKKKRLDGELEKSVKLCDRVPGEGEDSEQFIERNVSPGRGRRSNVDKTIMEASPIRPLRLRDKPLQDTNDTNSSTQKNSNLTVNKKRGREEHCSPNVSKKVKSNEIISTPIPKSKESRDISPDNEPLINLVRVSNRIKGLDKNKENQSSSDKKISNTVSPKQTPEPKRKRLDMTSPVRNTPVTKKHLKRPSIEDAIKEKDKLKVSIEKMPEIASRKAKIANPDQRVTKESSTTPKSRGRPVTRISELVSLTPKNSSTNRLSRLEQLTREFNQKFAIVKLKSLDDSSNTRGDSRISKDFNDIIKRRPRSKSVARTFEDKQEMYKDPEYNEMVKRRMQRSKSVARTIISYTGMQPAELMKENILESRMRSRGKSVARELSPEQTKIDNDRRRRARSVARLISPEKEVIVKAIKEKKVPPQKSKDSVSAKKDTIKKPVQTTTPSKQTDIKTVRKATPVEEL